MHPLPVTLLLHHIGHTFDTLALVRAGVFPMVTDIDVDLCDEICHSDTAIQQAVHTQATWILHDPDVLSAIAAALPEHTTTVQQQFMQFFVEAGPTIGIETIGGGSPLLFSMSLHVPWRRDMQTMLSPWCDDSDQTVCTTLAVGGDDDGLLWAACVLGCEFTEEAANASLAHCRLDTNQTLYSGGFKWVFHNPQSCGYAAASQSVFHWLHTQCEEEECHCDIDFTIGRVLQEPDPFALMPSSVLLANPSRVLMCAASTGNIPLAQQTLSVVTPMVVVYAIITASMMCKYGILDWLINDMSQQAPPHCIAFAVLFAHAHHPSDVLETLRVLHRSGSGDWSMVNIRCLLFNLPLIQTACNGLGAPLRGGDASYTQTALEMKNVDVVEWLLRVRGCMWPDPVPYNLILDAFPDHNARDALEWAHELGCPGISPTPRDTLVAELSSRGFHQLVAQLFYLRDNVTCSTMKSTIALPPPHASSVLSTAVQSSKFG